jgi:hypothetical protein
MKAVHHKNIFGFWAVDLVEEDRTQAVCACQTEAAAMAVADAFQILIRLSWQCEMSRYDRDPEVMNDCFAKILHLERSLSYPGINEYKPHDPIRDYL